MSDLPALPLHIALPGLGGLRCERALRLLPGRRWTLAGVLEGDRRAVVAKLFLRCRGGQRHFERERAGLMALHGRGVAAPQLLYAGPVDAPAGWLVLTAALDGTPADRLGEVARAPVLRAVAAQHAAGIEQTDAHLANFLVDGDVAWTLDGAGIRAHAAPLQTGRARRNLAVWLAQWPPGGATPPWQAYCTARADGRLPGDAPALSRAVAQARRRREQRLLTKVLRSCGAVAVTPGWRRFVAVTRPADTPALRAVLADPDAALAAPDSQWLKRGNSASVVRLSVDGRPVVVKRYNLKSLAHRLRRFWRPSRAWHSWRNAHRLRLWGVPTPPPVALLECRFGPLRGRAYYLSEAVAGETLGTVLPAADAARRARLLARLCALLAILERLRLTHGDLKATNLLVDPEDQLMLLDLDALRRHRRRAAFERAFARDLARLRANWNDDADLLAALDRALADAGLAR